jgi:anti-anti-sigma factor
MEIRVSNQPGRVPVTVFHIVGDIDTHTYEQLQTQAEQTHAAGAGNIVLDLEQVGYVSSAGIRAINHIFTLLRTQAAAESDEAVRLGINAGTFKSPHLKLARLNHRVTEALRIAGVDMFLEFHPDLETALASY